MCSFRECAKMKYYQLIIFVILHPAPPFFGVNRFSNFRAQNEVNIRAEVAVNFKFWKKKNNKNEFVFWWNVMNGGKRGAVEGGKTVVMFIHIGCVFCFFFLSHSPWTGRPGVWGPRQPTRFITRDGRVVGERDGWPIESFRSLSARICDYYYIKQSKRDC